MDFQKAALLCFCRLCPDTLHSTCILKEAINCYHIHSVQEYQNTYLNKTNFKLFKLSLSRRNMKHITVLDKYYLDASFAFSKKRFSVKYRPLRHSMCV